MNMENEENGKKSKFKRGNSRTSLRLSKRFSSAKLEELFKSPSLDFLGGKSKSKRKRHRTDEDTVSLHSVDLNALEPKKKRRASLAKIGSSLVSLVSPLRPVKKVSNALQKSFSLRNLASPKESKSKHNATPYKKPAVTPPRRRLSTFWCETVQNDDIHSMDKRQLDRQEAIYELYKGEEDLIEDVRMVKTLYHDSMRKLGLLSDDELKQIFGHIDTLIPLHQDLVDAMKDQRLPDGTTEEVGHVINEWVSKLSSYVSYCANQIYAKDLLDRKKLDPSVDDFLERCLDSPFSRKLDLWSFLDVPRSRLVKYPLLFKSILKFTPEDHIDSLLIEQAAEVVDDIIKQVDIEAGRSKCRFMKTKLEFLDDKQQRSPLIEESNNILCEGVLRNNRGTKLHVILFEKILVLTRPATRGQQLMYQVYRQPIPVEELVLEDLDGQTKMGSFKSAFSQGQQGKNGKNQAFKVSFLNPNRGQSHTLQANDEHDKKQWTQAILDILPHREETETGILSERGVGDGQEDCDNLDSISLASYGQFNNSRCSTVSLSSVNSVTSRCTTISTSSSSSGSGDD